MREFKGSIFLSALMTAVFLSASVPCLAEGSYSAPGQINNGGGGQIGKIGSDGNIYNGGGGQIGKIGSDGNIYNGGGGQIGKIGSDGTIYNGGGGEVGKIGSDGTVYNGGGGVIGHVPSGTVSALTHNGTSSVAQQEAEIRQMGQLTPQQQAAINAGPRYYLPPPVFPAQPAAIRNLEGELIGWMATPSMIGYEGEGYNFVALRPKILPEIQTAPKSVGLDVLMLENDGSITAGYRTVTKVAKVDKIGQITDLKGKKIAYFDVGCTAAYNSNPLFFKTRRDENGGDYFYPNVIGIVGLNGDVRDVHNRLAGHLDFDNIDSCQSADTHSLAKQAYKMIRHYESKNHWHKPKK